MSNETTNSQEPIQFRDGSVRAAIWTNVSKEHGKFYSVTVDRTYTVEENGQKVYKSTGSFSGAELLKVQRLLGMAYTKISELRAADFEQQKNAA